MTPRCATCKHWTPFTQEGEVVEAVYGTCRESPAKLGKPADEWCGRWSPSAIAAADELLYPTPPTQAEALAQPVTWPWREMGATYTVFGGPARQPTRPARSTPWLLRFPWWRRIFR